MRCGSCSEKADTTHRRSLRNDSGVRLQGMADMDYYVLQGTEDEMGTQRGKYFKDRFNDILALLAAKTPPQWVAWLDKKAIPYAVTNFPEIVEEIDAFAEACGTDRLHAFIYFYSQTKSWFSNHCSNIMVAESDSGPIFAKNMDPFPPELPYVCFYHVKPKKGHQLFGYGYIASFSPQGMNEVGLCDGGTSCSGTRPVGPRPEVGACSAFLSMLTMRRCRTIDEVLEIRKKYAFFDKGAANAYLDATGDHMALEETDTKSLVFRKHQGYSVVTTFNNGFSEWDWNDQFAMYHMPEAMARAERVHKMLKGKKHITVEHVKEILSSHGYGGLCHHPIHEKVMETACSYICLPNERKVLYTLAKPCQGEWKEFVFG